MIIIIIISIEKGIMMFCCWLISFLLVGPFEDLRSSWPIGFDSASRLDGPVSSQQDKCHHKQQQSRCDLRVQSLIGTIGSLQFNAAMPEQCYYCRPIQLISINQFVNRSINKININSKWFQCKIVDKFIFKSSSLHSFWLIYVLSFKSIEKWMFRLVHEVNFVNCYYFSSIQFFINQQDY